MKKIFGIIGYGRFGTLWAECLKPFGAVRVFAREKSSAVSVSKGKGLNFVSLREAVHCDFLFLLVPISEVGKVCKQIAPLLDSKTVVIDACSVKINPVKAMKSFLPASQPIIATHPLFGPDSVKRLGLAGQKIVVSNISAPKPRLAGFERILKTLRLKILHATPEEHDLQMARSQALVHFLGRGLSSLKLQEQAIATPDYNALLRMNEMVNNDTWQLFYDLQNFNPYTQKIRKSLLKSLQKLDHDLARQKHSAGH